MSTLHDPPQSPARVRLGAVLGYLVCLEVVSGLMQGYYNPILRDIADFLRVGDADMNWLEAGQLMLSAILVPVLARLADLVGHRQVLLASTLVTTLALWGIAFAPGFVPMLVAWTVSGAYAIWLPLEIALLHHRSGSDAAVTMRAAGILVGALEVSVIAGAVLAGALATHVGVRELLVVPAVAATIVLALLWRGLPQTPATATGRLDVRGLLVLAAALGTMLAGLATLRLQGADSVVAWVLVLAGTAALLPWSRLQLSTPSPLVDLRVLRGQWRIQVVALLLGVSILGAQVPLSLFGRTDPEAHGFGLGLTAAQAGGRLAFIVLCLALGSFLMPRVSRRWGQRPTLIGCCLLLAAGYAAWIPSHTSPGITMIWLALLGIGSGGLLVALPAAAAVAAPPDRTGSAAGLTNAVKSMGGAIGAAIFAVCLASSGSLRTTVGTGLAGYQAVWAICAATGVIGALLLLATPQGGDKVNP